MTENQGTVKLTAAQLLALNATPVTLVAAPGAGKVLVFERALLYLAYNSAAYAGIAGNEDLAIRYTGAAGLQLAQCEVTGFLDQTTSQLRHVAPFRAASGASDITPVANSPLVLHMLNGEITTGNSPLLVRTFYRILPAVLS